MRLLVQRVHSANVCVRTFEPEKTEEVARIKAGLLVFVGFGHEDNAQLPQSKIWTSIIDKLLHLRIFPGNTPETAHKFQSSVLDYGGEILLVSQFTLYAQCKQGRRPDFLASTAPALAKELFASFVKDVHAALPSRVFSGHFGANMDVSLVNWGPVTIMLDSEELYPSIEKTS